MDLIKILSLAFNSTWEGRGISDQLTCTFEGNESFDDQNRNALEYVLNFINEILKAELFSAYHTSEIEEYRDRLAEYLASN